MKHSGTWRAAGGHTHAASMGMPIVRLVVNAGYEAQLSKLISRLRTEKSVPTALSLSLWCSSDNISEEWFASSYEYWVNGIAFEVRLRRHFGRRFSSVGTISKSFIYRISVVLRDLLRSCRDGRITSSDVC